MSTETKIASRYAKAFFGLVAEGKDATKLEKEVSELIAVFKEEDALSSVLGGSSVRASLQLEIINDIAEKSKMDDRLANLLRVLCENRRLNILTLVLENILKAFVAHRGEIEAKIVSAKKLTAAQEKEIVKALSDKTGLNVKANVTVDAGLVGGIVVQVGSYMIDDSLKTKLEKAKRQLKGAA